MRIEASTLDTPPDLVRTIGRGTPVDSSRQRNGSRYSPGEVIADKYRLGKLIARGGMGEVWLAVHESLKTEIALKFSDDGIRSDPDRSVIVLERFLFEARVSARLGARTKHIVAVLDAGTYDNVPYLIMEFVRGSTLDDEISKQGPIAPERMAAILDQIADALDVAHGLGVIHRDLKPANVMLSQESGQLTVKVADFGVAKIVRADLALDRPKETPPNAIIGSPAYMSPEQMRANAPLDLRGDLWSLGVLVYEALTGHLPFGGRTMADLIVGISTQQPRPLAEHRPALGKTFDAWLARAIAKDPARRFGSAREMAQAFRSAVTPLKAQRSPPLFLLAGALLVVGALSTTLAILLTGSKTPTSVAPTSSLRAPSSQPSSPVPLVEPMGPPAVPSGDVAPAVVRPSPNNATTTAPTSAPTAPTAQPSASAESKAPPKDTTPTPKSTRPPKEFNRSEIQ